jgi:hypothetical protein
MSTLQIVRNKRTRNYALVLQSCWELMQVTTESGIIREPLGRPKQLEAFRYFDELSDGASLHLLHYAAAMNFDSDFTRSELRRNLFIEHSRNYQLHDLAFAGGQPLESRA